MKVSLLVPLLIDSKGDIENMKYLIVVLRYLPYVLKAVKAVEEEVGAGNGQTKKQLILRAVEAAAHVAGDVDQETVAMIGKLIDMVVGTLNESGLLDGKPRKAPVPVAPPLPTAMVGEQPPLPLGWAHPAAG